MLGSDLRLALVIPGAVSLGAYEAGVLSALLSLIRRSSGRLQISAVAGASAGSITGLILGHSLVSGAGDTDLQELWIEQADIRKLLKGRRQPGRPRAPLSTELLERWADQALAPPTAAAHPPIPFVASIATLRGFNYRLVQSLADRALSAGTFRDAKAFVLGPDTNWREAAETAVASAANPFGFSAKRLLRKHSEYPPGIDFPGEAANLWYTDGGVVYNEPIGFALDAVFDPKRVGLPPLEHPVEPPLFLVINAHPSQPPEQWPPDGGMPRFRSSSLHAMRMQMILSVYDDLRRLERLNSQIVARRELQAKVETLLSAGGEEEQAKASRDIEEIGFRAWNRKARIRELRYGDFTGQAGKLVSEIADRSTGGLSVHDLIDFLLDEVTGTGGKEIVDVEVISPEIGAGETPITSLIAGEPLFHFFGFAMIEARRSDFGLGYRNFRAWWNAYRARADSNLPDISPAPHPFEELPTAGDLSPRSIRWTRRWAMAGRLGIRYARELFARGATTKP
jgi:predicted acylesterase/phospholipase RssA